LTPKNRKAGFFNGQLKFGLLLALQDGPLRWAFWLNFFIAPNRVLLSLTNKKLEGNTQSKTSKIEPIRSNGSNLKGQKIFNSGFEPKNKIFYSPK